MLWLEIPLRIRCDIVTIFQFDDNNYITLFINILMKVSSIERIKGK